MTGSIENESLTGAIRRIDVDRATRLSPRGAQLWQERKAKAIHVRSQREPGCETSVIMLSLTVSARHSQGRATAGVTIVLQPQVDRPACKALAPESCRFDRCLRARR
jgi:hypothetical protein